MLWTVASALFWALAFRMKGCLLKHHLLTCSSIRLLRPIGAVLHFFTVSDVFICLVLCEGQRCWCPQGWAGAAQRDLDCSDWHQQSLLKEWFKSGGPRRLVPKLCIFSSLLCLQIQFSQHRRRLIIPWSLLTLVIVWKTSEIKKLSKPLKKKSAFLDYSFFQAPGTSLSLP